jgi:septal ring factor EnvC (AmiA/AmiB activator)
MVFTGDIPVRHTKAAAWIFFVFLMAVVPLVPFFLLTGSTIVLAGEAFTAGVLGNSSPDSPAKTREQEIRKKNATIRKLQDGIIDHKIKILGARKKEKTLLGELEKIEKDLMAQKSMLAELQAETERQELLLSDKQSYLKSVLAAKRAHQEHVKNRLAAYYRMGSVGLMNVVFAAESLPELLDFREYFGRMVQHDQTVIQEYLVQLQESNRAREDHAREKLRLMKLAGDVKENEARLTRIRTEKNSLLRQVNTEQHLYEQAVAEIEEAAADLAAALKRLRNAPGTQDLVETGEKVQEEERLPAKDTFPAQKGLLVPPVPGTVVTFFKQRVAGKFGMETVAEGIDIRIEKGVSIRAVYRGKIIHAGYLRGYGNLLIIDHGHQYFSLTSRAARLFVREGVRIETGEVVGITGEGDPLYGKGLHFEIRRGSDPEDPLLWLTKDGLSLEEKRAAEQ